jgi:hypothetical protein
MSGPTPTPTPCRFFSPACIAIVCGPQVFVLCFFVTLIVFLPFYVADCESISILDFTLGEARAFHGFAIILFTLYRKARREEKFLSKSLAKASPGMPDTAACSFPASAKLGEGLILSPFLFPNE